MRFEVPHRTQLGFVCCAPLDPNARLSARLRTHKFCRLFFFMSKKKAEPKRVGADERNASSREVLHLTEVHANSPLPAKRRGAKEKAERTCPYLEYQRSIRWTALSAAEGICLRHRLCSPSNTSFIFQIRTCSFSLVFGCLCLFPLMRVLACTLHSQKTLFPELISSLRRLSVFEPDCSFADSEDFSEDFSGARSPFTRGQCRESETKEGGTRVQNRD